MAIKFKVHIQQEAVDELDHIYQYLFNEAPRSARSFVGNLKKRILSLKSLPYRGTRVRILEDPKSKREIRFIEHKKYLIFYTVIERDVTILHVAGPGQNWIQLLS